MQALSKIEERATATLVATQRRGGKLFAQRRWPEIRTLLHVAETTSSDSLVTGIRKALGEGLSCVTLAPDGSGKNIALRATSELTRLGWKRTFLQWKDLCSSTQVVGRSKDNTRLSAGVSVRLLPAKCAVNSTSVCRRHFTFCLQDCCFVRLQDAAHPPARPPALTVITTCEVLS